MERTEAPTPQTLGAGPGAGPRAGAGPVGSPGLRDLASGGAGGAVAGRAPGRGGAGALWGLRLSLSLSPPSALAPPP